MASATASFFERSLLLTFVQNVAHGAVVQDHDLAQVWLYLAEILDVCAVPKGAMLTVVPRAEVLAFLLKVIDDWVCVFLY